MFLPPPKVALLAWVALLLGQAFGKVVGLSEEAAARRSRSTLPAPVLGHPLYNFVTTDDKLSINVSTKGFQKGEIPLLQMSFHPLGMYVDVKRELIWMYETDNKNVEDKITVDELITILWPLQTGQSLEGLNRIIFRNNSNVDLTESIKRVRKVLNVASLEQSIKLTDADYWPGNDSPTGRARKKAWTILSETPIFKSVERIALKAVADDQGKTTAQYLKDKKPGQPLQEVIHSSPMPIVGVDIVNRKWLDNVIFTFKSGR